MNKIFSFGITKLIFSILKFLFIYLLLGYLALVVIAICEGVTVLCEMDWDFYRFAISVAERSNENFIDGVRAFLLNGIPFNEIADKMTTDSGSIINIFEGFGDDNRITFHDFFVSIFPDTVKIIIANFVIFMFARINVLISKILNGISFKIGIFISMGILGIAGFSVSIAVIDIIALYTPSGLKNIIYCVLAFVCFILHSIFLSNVGTKCISFGRVTRFLAKNLFIGLLNSFICWFVCFHLNGLYNYSHFFAFYVAFLVFCVVLALERNSVKFKFEK